MSYGLTADGFSNKPLEVIKAEIETELKETIDPGLNVTASSVTGQFIGVFSDKLSELWDACQAVYSAYDPSAAEGVSLDNLSTLTATLRLEATKSTVTASVNLNNGTTLPVGSKANVAGDTSSVFVTIEEISNSSGITADFNVDMEAEVTGPVAANAGTLTEILTPVAGWNSITNAADAILGITEETDSALRIRRETELTAQGAATIDAIRADLLNVDDVEEVKMFENITLITDGDGLPGKSFEAVVLGGTDVAIAQQLFDSKAAGMQPYGVESENATDSEGNAHAIGFTRPTEIVIYCEVDLLIDADTYPADGDDQVKAAILAKINELFGIGDDVILSRLYSAIYTVSGVIDVTDLMVDDVTPTVATGNFAIGTKEIAAIITARIDVDTTPA